MKSVKIILRSHGGTPLVRRLVSVGERVVYVSDENEDLVVGIPKEDVFDFDRRLEKDVLGFKPGTGSFPWELLRKYSGERRA